MGTKSFSLNRHRMLHWVSCIFASSLILILYSQSVNAQRWIAIDSRARAMGQTGVAAINGSNAGYWNPANLGSTQKKSHKGWNSTVNFDGLVDLNVEGDVINTADRLSDLLDEISLDALSDSFNSGQIESTDLRDMFRLVDSIAALTQPGSGAVADVGAGVSFERDNFAVSYRYLSRIGLSAFLDLGADSGLTLADDGLADLNTGLQLTVQQRLLQGQTLNQPGTESGQLFSQQLRDIGAAQGVLITSQSADEFSFQAEQALGSRLDDTNLLGLLESILQATGNSTNAGSDLLFFDQNQSGIIIKGITLQELAFSRRIEIPIELRKLRVGFGVRLLHGRTFFQSISFREIDNGKQLISDIFNSFNTENRSTVRATLDTGLAYKLSETVNVGLSARNIIPVKFKYADGSNFHLDPLVRAGISYHNEKFPWFTLTMDADLTKNKSEGLPGLVSRNLGGGLELTLQSGGFRYALRAGLFANLHAERVVPVYTIGFALEGGPFYIALEGNIAPNTVKVESASTATGQKNFPERVGASLNIGFRF